MKVRAGEGAGGHNEVMEELSRFRCRFGGSTKKGNSQKFYRTDGVSNQNKMEGTGERWR